MSWLRQHKWFYWLVAMVSLLLGLLGVLLPLLPTTPFIILALWAASRCSPRLAAWLENHPRFGPLIAAWQRNRAIPLVAKCLACGMMVISFVLLWSRGVGTGWLVVIGMILLLIMTYILSRPSR